MIKICIPSRFEMELLDGLEALQRETGAVHEVYGSLSRSVVGSGRPARRLVQHGGSPSFGHVREFSERAHELGIRVNYLLNAACLDMTEYTAQGRGQLVEYIHEVAGTGVDMVTVAVPYLIELVRSEVPELPVSVSVINEVSTSNSLRMFEGFGVQRVQLGEECNRDFGALELLTRSARAELSLVVNNGCLRFCAYRNYHNTLCSQGSQTGKPQGGYIDYPLLKCSAMRAHEPVEILRSPWIRPEDLSYYHDRFGIELFKLAGRQLPLQSILTMATAYATETYEGNFMDLLATPAVDFSAHPMTAGLAAERGEGSFGRPAIQIDNQRLGKLTRALHSRGGCGALRDCEECRLCDVMAAALMADEEPELREAHARTLDGLIGELAQGSWVVPASTPSGQQAGR